MNDSLSNTQLQQIKQVFREVLNEKMSWHIKEKFTNIENNLENFLQLSRTNLRTMRDFNTKYATLKK